MQWLLVALANLFASVAAEFTKRGLAKYAFVIATLAVWATSFTAALVASILAVKALAPLAPQQIAFGLGLLPPATPAIYSTWISIVITKRLYDYYIQRSKQLFLI